ncbi:hypothetical protein, partial [Pseudomonas gingeri]
MENPELSCLLEQFKELNLSDLNKLSVFSLLDNPESVLETLHRIRSSLNVFKLNNLVEYVCTVEEAIVDNVGFNAEQ